MSKRHAELKGTWQFPALDNFELVGKADRLDVKTDGTLEIIDFKTGGVPAPGGTVTSKTLSQSPVRRGRRATRSSAIARPTC